MTDLEAADLDRRIAQMERDLPEWREGYKMSRRVVATISARLARDIQCQRRRLSVGVYIGVCTWPSNSHPIRVQLVGPGLPDWCVLKRSGEVDDEVSLVPAEGCPAVGTADRVYPGYQGDLQIVRLPPKRRRLCLGRAYVEKHRVHNRLWRKILMG